MRVRRTKAEIAAGVTLEQAKANREAEVKQEIITEPVPPVEDGRRYDGLWMRKSMMIPHPSVSTKNLSSQMRRKSNVD